MAHVLSDQEICERYQKSADIPEIVFTLVADNLERVNKDIQAEEVKISELYKQQKDMLGFLKNNGILK